MGEALAIQTIDNATDAIFFEAATIISDVMKIVCVTQKLFLIPETIDHSTNHLKENGRHYTTIPVFSGSSGPACPKQSFKHLS